MQRLLFGFTQLYRRQPARYEMASRARRYSDGYTKKCEKCGVKYSADANCCPFDRNPFDLNPNWHPDDDFYLEEDKVYKLDGSKQHLADEDPDPVEETEQFKNYDAQLKCTKNYYKAYVYSSDRKDFKINIDFDKMRGSGPDYVPHNSKQESVSSNGGEHRKETQPIGSGASNQNSQ